MRKFTLLNLLLLLIFCASCAQAQKAKPASKLTNTSAFNELLIGRSSAQPLPAGFQKDIAQAIICFKPDLKASVGFQLFVIKNRLRIESGHITDLPGTEACLVEKKLMRPLESFWIWTPDQEIPKEVGKNWISLTLDSVRVFKGPKAQ